MWFTVTPPGFSCSDLGTGDRNLPLTSLLRVNLNCGTHYRPASLQCIRTVPYLTLLIIFVVNKNDKIINLKSILFTYLCLGPSIISLLMRLSTAFLASALLLINWELSHNAGSVCHKLIRVSLSLSLNFMSAICLLYTNRLL